MDALGRYRKTSSAAAQDADRQGGEQGKLPGKENFRPQESDGMTGVERRDRITVGQDAGKRKLVIYAGLSEGPVSRGQGGELSRARAMQG